jgi:general secretion pathway protein G
MRAQKRPKLLSFLFVAFIVAIALFLLTPTLWNPTVRKGKSQSPRIRLAELEGALQMFAFDVGHYPNTSEGLHALIESPGDLKSWKGPYLAKPDVLNDPWNRPFIYRCPGQHGAYDIFSYGCDGVEGGEGEDADITSWEK